MGSYSETTSLLDYVRSKSQVDCDCLDIEIAKNLGPFFDSTSNQADAYLELLLPHRAEILRSSAALAREILSEYENITFEQLAVEIAMCKLSLHILPYITGSIHVMTNPTITSTSEIVENARRLSNHCQRLQPSFDTSRLCVKVLATWEGLQACRKLTVLGINTLATTLFTIEQAILAAEAGCVYIAPFVHELKAFFDETYDDGGPNLALCLEAQRYYKQHSQKTRVKAAGLLTIGEAKQLAGVTSLTIAPELLQKLSDTQAELPEAAKESIFTQKEVNGSSCGKEGLEHRTYLNDEKAYREAFAKSYGGKGEVKTKQAISIFCDYQDQAEALMLKTQPSNHG
ncbi:transaldolase [Usnea florida]